jgi:hypothetical protein
MVRALIKFEANKALAVSPLFCFFKQYALVDNSPWTNIVFLKCFILQLPVVIFNSAYTEKRCSLRCDTFRHTKMRQNDGGPIPWNQGPWGILFTKKFLEEIFQIFVLRTIRWLISVCCWHSTLPLLCLLMGAAGSGCCVYVLVEALHW